MFRIVRFFCMFAHSSNKTLTIMKRFFQFLLCVATVVTLGACGNEKGDGPQVPIDKQIVGDWAATRQVVTIKVNGTVLMEDDEPLTLEDGMVLSFTSGKQLFALMCVEVDGKVEVDDHFYAGQWSIDGKKLKIEYVDNGEEGEGDEGFLDMGDMTIESISDTQLVLVGYSENVVEGQTISTTVKIYLTRQDFEWDYDAIP